jgi:uncharacterized membrane protein YfcA
MLEADLATLVLLCAAAGLAGCIDAISGGGGLVMVPALFGAFPRAPPAALFGTNKAAAVWGTAWAAGQYVRRVRLRARVWLPGIVATAAGALCGAWSVTRVPAAPLRLALPLVLVAVLAYVLARPQLGRSHRPRWAGHHETLAVMLMGAGIGFYDGIFGPGTGSFFVFAGVRLLGYDFLHASAGAKLLNATSNLAALALFGLHGVIAWQVALPMALANVAGSYVGTRLALARGAGFVRGVFLAVVSVLIGKTAWDAWMLLR